MKLHTVPVLALLPLTAKSTVTQTRKKHSVSMNETFSLSLHRTNFLSKSTKILCKKCNKYTGSLVHHTGPEITAHMTAQMLKHDVACLSIPYLWLNLTTTFPRGPLLSSWLINRFHLEKLLLFFLNEVYVVNYLFVLFSRSLLSTVLCCDSAPNWLSLSSLS